MVEFVPAYDPCQITAISAANIVWGFIALIVSSWQILINIAYCQQFLIYNLQIVNNF